MRARPSLNKPVKSHPGNPTSATPPDPTSSAASVDTANKTYNVGDKLEVIVALRSVVNLCDVFYGVRRIVRPSGP
jgi:hypothetical protein